MKITEWARRMSAKSRRKRRDQQRRRELWAELGHTRLETRRVLNGGAVTSAVVVDAGDAANDGQDDSIKVDISQDQVNVSINGNHQATYAVGEIDTLSIQGSSDNDQIDVQWVDGPIDGLRIEIDGVSGDDQLALTESQYDPQHLQSIIHSIETSGSGQLDLIGADSLQQLDYLNLDAISNQLAEEQTSVGIQSGGNQITLGSNLAAGMHSVAVEDVQGETFTLMFSNEIAEVDINTESTGDNSGDQITFDQLNLSGANDWSVIGDDSDLVSFVGQNSVGDSSFTVQAGSLSLTGEMHGDHANVSLVGDSSVTSGDEFRLSNDGGDVFIAGPSLEIAGTISAAGGEVTVDSGDDGTTIIRALIDVSDGSATSTGQQQIKILGQNVGLLDQATLDASGTFGGGAIYVGGGFQGSNPALRNAQRTYVGAEVLLRADAIESGDGGQVIVWANDWTKFFGTIHSSGGQLAGNGGDAEVSGKGTLTFAGNADLSAPLGATGTLLLDPENIVIDDSSGTENGQLADQQVLFAEGGATDSDIQPSAFETTNANITFQATNDITISSDIDLTNSGNTLALQAGEDILINANITSASGANNIIFEADSPHSGSNNGSGQINFDAVSVSSNGGDITLIGASFDLDATVAAGAGDIYITTSNNSQLTMSSGGISATEINNLSTSGTLVFGRATSAGTDNNGTSATTLTAATILVSNDTTINALTTSNIEMYAVDGITLDRDLIATAAITIDADTDNDGTGTLTVTASDVLRTNNNALSITAGDIALAGDIDSGTALTTIIDSDGDGIGLGDTAVTDALNLSGGELQNIDSTGLTLQTTGAVTVDGVSAANSNNVAGTLTIDADTVTFSGDSSTFNALDVQADDRVTINANITTDTGALSIDGNANASGDTNDDVVIAAGVTLDAQTDLTLAGTGGIAAAGSLNLTVGGSLTISDNLAVTGDLTITDDSGNGIGLGDTPVVGGLNLTGADLAKISVTNLELVTGASITVDNISAANSNSITNFGLTATGSVSFVNNASVFNALDVKADDRVAINVDLTTDTGILSINGDVDAGADTNDDIQIADGVKVEAATVLTLAAATGGIATAGVATLTAGTNVVISNAVTAGGNLEINADDLTLSAAIAAGVNDVTITDNDGDGIGLGDTAVTDGLNLSSAELQLITADELTLVTQGEIEVDNVTAANSNNIATVVLDATTYVQFDSTASTFNALDVQADDRITVNVNVTTDTGALSLDGDTDNAADTNDDIQIADSVTLQAATSLTLTASNGGITTVGTANLNAGTDVILSNAVTAGGNLGITTNDLALTAAINAGVNDVTLTDTDGTGIGLGDATIVGGVNISGAELQLITANNLTLATSGAIEVDNVTATNSNNVANVILDSGGSVLIDSVASTFNAVDIQADDGVTISSDLTSDTGSITINGDTNNAADASDNIQIASGLTLDAATSLNLAATTGGITTAGTATLTAGTTVTISDAVTAGGNLAINANDLTVSAAINAGVNDVTITDGDGDGIGLGDIAVTGGLNLSGAELQLITADDLTLISAGEIEVDNVSATNSNNIATVVLDSATYVQFDSSASTFNSLDVQADDGVVINENVTTDTGILNIDGDTNASVDGNDDIQIGSGVTLQSATSLQLVATNGGITTAGTANLIAGTDVVFSDAVTAGGNLSISTNDLTVSATINAGANDVTITDNDGDGIGLGDATIAGGVNLSGAELQLITANNLTLDTAGAIEVDNVTAANSNNVTTVVLSSDSSVLIDSVASTFNALNIQADNRVTINSNLTTDTGFLSIDGDANSMVDGNDDVILSAGITLSAATDLTLAGTSGLNAAGDLFLVAGGDLNVNDPLNVTADLTITNGNNNGIGLGDTTIVGGLNFSGADLQNITSANLTLVTGGSITVDNITAANGNNVSGTVTLDAVGSVSFASNASTFNTLDVQAEDGVVINADLTTDTGAITIDGDTDDAADVNDNVQIGNGVTIDSATSLTLTATTGGISTQAANLVAGTDVILSDAVTATGNLGITTNDLTVSAAINAGANDVTITDNDGSGIGLGDSTVVGGVNLSGAELQLITANNLNLTTAGAIEVDNVTAANSNNVTTVVLDSASSILFDSNASVFNALDVQADNRVTITSDLTTDVGALSIDGDADSAVDGNDDVVINAGLTLTATTDLTLAGTSGISAAGDLFLDIGGNLTVSDALNVTNDLTITNGNNVGIGLGDTAIVGGLNFSGSDLQNITAANLNLITGGSISVDNITAANSDNISGTVTLDASGSVSFLNTTSTFNAVDVQADDGVVVNVNLTTDTGAISIDGDADNAADGNDDVQFAGGVTLNSATDLSLAATTSGLQAAGTLDLIANGTVTVSDQLDATGNLTLQTDDFDVTSAISSTADISITEGDGDGIGVGSTTVAGGLNLTAAELQNLSAANLSLITSGSIVVNNISATNSDNISGMVTLDAATVSFVTSASTFNSLDVQADDGVTVSADLTTETGTLTINADDDAGDSVGTLTVDAGVNVSSSDNAIVITVNDVDIQGGIVSGNASTTIIDSDGDGIGLGSAIIAGGLNLSVTDLQDFTATGLTLQTAGNVDINGMSQPITISGVTNVISGGEVNFITAASSFNALSVQADDGITANVDVTTTVGSLSLDGDADNALDTNDNILIGVGVQIASAGSMTLDATTGGIIGNGALTLNAADGITVNDSLTSSGALTFNSDTDAGDDVGTLTIAAGAAVSSANNTIALTVNDLDVQGTISSGAASTTITDSDGDGIGLGDTAVVGGLNISDSDLDPFTTTGLTIQTSGQIIVDNLSQPINIAGTTTLDAGTTISFSNNASSFNSLIANADDGISVDADITTTSGDLLIDGNADGDVDATDNVTFITGAQLQSAGEMTLRASTGGLTGAGVLTLFADDGINIDHSLSTNGTLTIDADTDANDDDGTLTLAAGQTIDSNSNTIDITADDLSIGGSVTSGTASTSIRDSDGDGVGLGDAVIAGGLNLSVTDLQDFTANGLTVGTTGNIQVDNFSPPVTISGAMTLTADGATSTVSFLNNASSFNSLAVNASDGVTVGANLSTTAGGLTINADTDAGDGAGTFQVNAGIGVSSSNNTIDITTNDLVLLGTLDSGAALTTINDSDGTGIGLGDTAVVNGLNLTSATAGQITSTGLTLTTTGNATVDNFVQPGSISGTATIQTGGSISFANAASSFETLDAQADDGISVSQNITTTTGGLTLDGDANNTGNTSDDIQFAANVQLQSAAEITLAATTGGMSAAGALTINGDDGVTFEDSLTANGILTINADSAPGDDDGTLTINTGASVSTTNQAISITADSLSIDGSVDSGNAATTIIESDGDGISLGDTNVPGAMNFAAADLLNFTAGDFTLQTSGDITVDNAALPGSITGSAFLTANGTSSQIQFINNGSSFGTLTVSASDGVTVDAALATTGGALTIDADADAGDNAGTLSVTVNGSLDSGGQAIAITANDVDFTGTVNSGAADVTVTDSDGTGLGLGSSVIVNGLNISDAELDQITAVNFVGTSTGDIYVNGISQPGTISNEIQLAAGGTVFFTGASSSFNSATVNAEDGISVAVDVASTGGDLTFDGDSDNAADTNDNITFSAGTTVQAASTLNLSATTGGMTGAGALNLSAADGVNLNDSLTTSGTLTINADQDANDNNGTLFIDAAATVDTNNNTLLVTANDLNVQGAVTSGTAATSLIDSDGDGVGLGDTSVTDGLNISMLDLASFTADGLNIQSTGSIIVDNVSLPISITGTTSLQSGATIQFSNNASTFPGLDAQAEDGIQVNVNLITSSGDLLLNGDSDDTADTIDNITFVAGTTLNSAGAMTLQSTTGGMTAAGALNLTANDGVTINSALSTSGTLTVVADNDAGDNSGTFTVAGTGAVDTNDNQLLITANDIDLTGTLDSGTTATVFTDSDGTSIGIGDSNFVNGFNLSSSELQNVTGTDVQFITSNFIFVDNITAASSDNLAGTTLLDAGNQLVFSNNASTFNALDAEADNGLAVAVDLTTDTGSLSLDGDANNVVDGSDLLQLSSGLTLTAADAITLEATNGNITGLGSLNLNAADDVNIIDDMTVSGVLTVNADTDAGDNDGQFNIAATGSLETSNNALVVTADSLSLSGVVSSGTASTTFHDSDGNGIGLGSAAVANGLNLSNADAGQITATGLNMTTAGNLDIQSFTQPGTITGTVTLTGSGGASNASFSNGASSFSGLDLTVDDTVTVSADVSASTGDLKLSGGGTTTVSAGSQLIGAGAGSTVEVTGGDITLNNGSSGSETISNTAGGTISLTSSTGDINLGNFALASDTGIITVNSAGAIDELSDNATVSLSTTGAVTLNAVGDIGQSAGVGLAGDGPLDVDVDSISAASTTGGVYLRDANGFTVSGVATNSANAELISDTSVNLTGAITATTAGDIFLSAPVITLGADGDITTDDGDISIDASNAGGLTIDDGAVLTTDQGSISGQIINAADPFSGTSFTGEPLSDSDRNAIINVVIADSGATNVEVLINWGEGDTDEMTPVISAPPGDDRAFVVQSTIPAPSGGVDFIHDYQNPPDPDNPSDDISVVLSINQFAAGTIDVQVNSVSVFDDSRFDDFEVIVEVDSAILPFFIAIPEDNTQLAQPASDPVLIVPSKVRRTLSMTSNQIIASSIGSAEQVDQRYYVLRIVSFGEEGDIKLMKDGSEYRLPNLDDPDSESGFQLNQLPELFERLPDDRYKIYLIDGQTERLVLDFIIRDGQPIEAEAEEPQQQAAADQPAVEKQFELEPVIDDGANAGKPKQNSDGNGTLRLTSPVSLRVPAKMTPKAVETSVATDANDQQHAQATQHDPLEETKVQRHQTPSVAQRLGTMPVAAAGSTLMMASMHQLRKRSARRR